MNWFICWSWFLHQFEGPVLQLLFSLFSFLFSKNNFEFAFVNRFSFYFQKTKTKWKTKSVLKLKIKKIISFFIFFKLKKLTFSFLFSFLFVDTLRCCSSSSSFSSSSSSTLLRPNRQWRSKLQPICYSSHSATADLLFFVFLHSWYGCLLPLLVACICLIKE